VYSKHCTRI